MDRVKILQDTPHKEKNGIFVVSVPTVVSANRAVRKILENYSDSKTALFLSGGSTPRKLYEDIASEKTLRVGSVLQVDERFGEKLHRHSNELMIQGTSLLKYFDEQNIRFYPMIEDKEIQQTSKDYDETLRFLFKYFPKSVGILGIGEDGHTAGIPAGNQNSKGKTSTFAKASADKQSLSRVSKRILEDQSSLVSYYELEGYGPRVTMTFLALSQLDLILILVLGQEKREALRLMFTEGSIEEVPARFYLRPEIAEKTILVTDQIV